MAAPNLLSLLYWGVIAAPVYRSEAVVIVSNPSQEAARLRVALVKDAQDIAAWRAHSGYYAPSTDYDALTQQALRLDERHIELEGQLRSIQKTAPNNPAMASIGTQMGVIDSRAAEAHGAAKALFPKASEFEALELRRQTDAKLLEAAETALQESRIKAAQNHYYLKTISESSQPHSPSGPQRLKWILIVAITTLVLRTLLA